MSDLIKHKTTGNGLMSLTFGDDSFPLTPFAQEIELLNTEVAGTRYHQAAEHLDALGPGVELTLRRQPATLSAELKYALKRIDVLEWLWVTAETCKCQGHAYSTI